MISSGLSISANAGLSIALVLYHFTHCSGSFFKQASPGQSISFSVYQSSFISWLTILTIAESHLSAFI
jgi:hypothetical protein